MCLCFFLSCMCYLCCLSAFSKLFISALLKAHVLFLIAYRHICLPFPSVSSSSAGLRQPVPACGFIFNTLKYVLLFFYFTLCTQKMWAWLLRYWTPTKISHVWFSFYLSGNRGPSCAVASQNICFNPFLMVCSCVVEQDCVYFCVCSRRSAWLPSRLFFFLYKTSRDGFVITPIRKSIRWVLCPPWCCRVGA